MATVAAEESGAYWSSQFGPTPTSSHTPSTQHTPTNSRPASRQQTSAGSRAERAARPEKQRGGAGRPQSRQQPRAGPPDADRSIEDVGGLGRGFVLEAAWDHRSDADQEARALMTPSAVQLSVESLAATRSAASISDHARHLPEQLAADNRVAARLGCANVASGLDRRGCVGSVAPWSYCRAMVWSCASVCLLLDRKSVV